MCAENPSALLHSTKENLRPEPVADIKSKFERNLRSEHDLAWLGKVRQLGAQTQALLLQMKP